MAATIQRSRVLWMLVFSASALLLGQSASALSADRVSNVWNPDQGDGSYKNPVLYADYSDPDAIRVGKDFYMVASSFDAVPGLPILHSTDLVHWELIGHGLQRQPPLDRYRTVQHGNGAWAPSIRYHAGDFFIFYPDPDYGIYMIKSRSIRGPWSQPLLIKAAKGWIDPCPLWENDGKAYLINAFAASRSGLKSALVISRMAADGSKLLDDGAIVIDGHNLDPTLEGPKLYKRHGYYYVFAPAGGVPIGWQLVYRSKSIYGPYERRVVLAQGDTTINGPHQGAWITTPQGESWFLHFQDAGAYGRVVRLEPMRWRTDNWPEIGVNITSSGVGEPVASYRKRRIDSAASSYTPADSDEFNGAKLGLQWQWQANPEPNWAFPTPALGVLRLMNVPVAGEDVNLWNVPNLLLQKFSGPEFTATAKLHFLPRGVGDKTGLVVLGSSYSDLEVDNTRSGLVIRQTVRENADQDGKSIESVPIALHGDVIYLRAKIDRGAKVFFSYSEDGAEFHQIGTAFQAVPGRWIGAKIGLFAIGDSAQGELGCADYDWFRMER